MRFDDMLATVLAQPASRPGERVVAWRQIVDLLAQSRTDDDVRLERDAYRRLREWRDEVPAETRRAVAGSLAGRRVPSALVAFFGEDAADVAAPLIATVEMGGEDWAALVPTLTPTARALLRNRRDLPGEAGSALDAFGSVDFVLGGPAAEGMADPARNAEAIQTERDRKPDVSTPALIERFDFEAGADHRIRWVDVSAREALIGLNLGDAAWGGSEIGVDGQVVGALRARARIEGGRLVVAGAGVVGGAWRLFAEPWFDMASGRFQGYRGRARRPRPDEEAAAIGQWLPGGSISQMMHEVRTPLTAILGFAEMIEHGVLGGASRATKKGAGAVLADARRVMDAVEDMELALRLDRGMMSGRGEGSDAAAILAEIAPLLRKAAEMRSIRVEIDRGRHPAPIAIAGHDASRMIARLGMLAVAVAASGHPLRLWIEQGGEMVRAFAERNARGPDKAGLLAMSSVAPDEDGAAPILGVDFSLRLLKRFAEAHGCGFEVLADRFFLTMPAAAAPDARTTAS